MLAFSFIFSMVSQSVKYLKLLSPKIQHRSVRELADSSNAVVASCNTTDVS